MESAWPCKKCDMLLDVERGARLNPRRKQPQHVRYRPEDVNAWIVAQRPQGLALEVAR